MLLRRDICRDKGCALPYSEVTPKNLYVSRREFIQAAAAAGAVALTGGSVMRLFAPATARASANLQYTQGSLSTHGEKLTQREDITHYNNFYEFATDKEGPAKLADKFKPQPWTVKVEGLVAKPQTLDYDALLKLSPLEERVYRHRCVEGWSMVIPWIGFPMKALLDRVQPTGKARFVEFTTVMRPSEMPGQRGDVLDWPYVEGLRLDEAMNPLALFAVGLYGDVLPNQNGAPFRAVVPWKYGFKSAKSIVKIRLVEQMPQSTWNRANAREYGFYSNVNPQVDYPRWSQAKERRIGELFKRNTLMFNGYGQWVADLYKGMDLRKDY